MGKRIIPQRRGRGGPRYRAKSHRSIGRISYPLIKSGAKVEGQITDIMHDPIRSAPVAQILLEDFSTVNLIAHENVRVGQWVVIGKGAPVTHGNVLALGDITEGTEVYNIEVEPGDGGKLIRTSGAFGAVVSHDRERNLTYVRMPSKKTVTVNSSSWATVGRVGGGGRTEKMMVHAGQKYHAKKARNKRYPKVCGRCMNAQSHPHGAGRHKHVGKPSTISRNTPPGRKVGHLAAKRTGRKR